MSTHPAPQAVGVPELLKAVADKLDTALVNGPRPWAALVGEALELIDQFNNKDMA